MEDPKSPLAEAWRALGHRLAAAVGAITALVALMAEAPLHVACVRGGAAWVSIAAASWGAQLLLARLAPPERRPSSEADGPSQATQEEVSTLKGSEVPGR